MTRGIFMLGVAIFFSGTALAAPLKDEALQKYFSGEVARIESSSLAGIGSREEWLEQRGKLRAELFEMLGLDPARERSDLRAVVTGKVEREGIVVEKLHFQSSPGLYVTANFYRPAKVEKPLPTILYVCGHGQVKTNGISYGNKVAYQHHGAWFARNGYTCLTIDTIQLGEIEGKHHGTYRDGMWWWNSRGYTPAGVEAWNCMRALDYLETRSEVDKTRFGVTGRSGGGAYSWWIAALDDRIKVAAPVAGITDLRDHVVDGVVEGHCDCMYFVNTYQWDYPAVAALVAPRPLLIANSDKDTIFPLDGVVRTHSAIAKVYGLLGAEKNLGLLITEGPHKDTQDLQLPVFRWFNRHLKGEDPVIEMAATKLFTGQELKVFETIPEDEITSKIHETFVPKWGGTNKHKVPDERIAELRELLRQKAFAAWPSKKAPFNIERKNWGKGFHWVEFDSQEHVRLKLYSRTNSPVKRVFLHIVPEDEPLQDILARLNTEHRYPQPGTVDAVLTVRGSIQMQEPDRTFVQTKRRYMLAGQTLDGMRVWDMLRAVELVRQEFGEVPIVCSVFSAPAKNMVIAKLFGAAVTLESWNHETGEPDYLSFLKYTSWAELRHLTGVKELNQSGEL